MTQIRGITRAVRRAEVQKALQRRAVLEERRDVAWQAYEDELSPAAYRRYEKAQQRLVRDGGAA